MKYLVNFNESNYDDKSELDIITDEITDICRDLIDPIDGVDEDFYIKIDLFDKIKNHRTLDVMILKKDAYYKGNWDKKFSVSEVHPYIARIVDYLVTDYDCGEYLIQTGNFETYNLDDLDNIYEMINQVHIKFYLEE